MNNSFAFIDWKSYHRKKNKNIYTLWETFNFWFRKKYFCIFLENLHIILTSFWKNFPFLYWQCNGIYLRTVKYFINLLLRPCLIIQTTIQFLGVILRLNWAKIVYELFFNSIFSVHFKWCVNSFFFKFIKKVFEV